MLQNASLPRFAASLFRVVVRFRRCASAAPRPTRCPPPKGFSPTDGGPQTRSGRNIGDWCQLATIALEDRSSAVYRHLASDDEVIIGQRVLKQLLKTIRGRA